MQPPRQATDQVPAPLAPSAPLRYEAAVQADDYLAARRLSMRPRRRLRIAMWVLGIPFIAVLVLDSYFGASRGRPHPFLASLLGAGMFLLIWYHVLLPLQVRRAYQQTNDALPVVGEFTATGLSVGTTGMRGALAWSEVAKWKRDDRIILLYSAEGEYTIIPLRGFASASQREAAFAFLEQRLGPAEA